MYISPAINSCFNWLFLRIKLSKSFIYLFAAFYPEMHACFGWWSSRIMLKNRYQRHRRNSWSKQGNGYLRQLKDAMNMAWFQIVLSNCMSPPVEPIISETGNRRHRKKDYVSRWSLETLFVYVVVCSHCELILGRCFHAALLFVALPLWMNVKMQFAVSCCCRSIQFWWWSVLYF